MCHLGNPYRTPAYCEISDISVQRSEPIFQAAGWEPRKGKLSTVQIAVVCGLTSETGDCHKITNMNACVSASHIASSVEINVHQITAIAIVCSTSDSGDGIAALMRQTNGTERTNRSFRCRLQASLLVL